MARKVDARILKLETEVASLARVLETQIKDFGRFVEASKKDWKYLREYCNQKIEGN